MVTLARQSAQSMPFNSSVKGSTPEREAAGPIGAGVGDTSSLRAFEHFDVLAFERRAKGRGVTKQHSLPAQVAFRMRQQRRMCLARPSRLASIEVGAGLVEGSEGSSPRRQESEGEHKSVVDSRRVLLQS